MAHPQYMKGRTYCTSLESEVELTIPRPGLYKVNELVISRLFHSFRGQVQGEVPTIADASKFGSDHATEIAWSASLA